MKNHLWKAWQKVAGLFITKFPGKNTVNALIGGAVAITISVSLILVYSLFSEPYDSSRLGTSHESIRDQLSKSSGVSVQLPKSMSDQAPSKEDKPRVAETRKSFQINYRAKQVIERSDFSGPFLPVGTEFIGRLMTSIDTRELGTTKIELPYGGSFQGNELLPRGSILFATVRYDGNGEKVFLDIQSGTYPNGEEFKIRGEILSARDFSPGISGDYHGTFSSRVASQLGLNFVTGLSDTLQEKEALGSGGFSGGTITTKPTLKNGLLAGVSKVTGIEAQRMASELSGQKPYVTIESGKELIVRLLEKFVKTK